jgi:hypothetical protein
VATTATLAAPASKSHTRFAMVTRIGQGEWKLSPVQCRSMMP